MCIPFCPQVKSGPFAEHSNILWGISGLHEWSKVNSGLIKMYKAEVSPVSIVGRPVCMGNLMVWHFLGEDCQVNAFITAR